MSIEKKMETLDLGTTLLNLEAEYFSSRTAVTAFVNNMSVRAYALHLQRPRDLFIDAVLAASDIHDPTEEEQLALVLDELILNTLLKR